MSKLLQQRKDRWGKPLRLFRYRSSRLSLEAINDRLSNMIAMAELFEAGSDREAVMEVIDSMKWAQIHVVNALQALGIWKQASRKPQDDLEL